MRTKESVHKAASAQPPDADEEEETTTTARRRFIGQCNKGNCCLEDGHAGSCNEGNMSEEEYEVECITAEKATRGGKRKFLVKWKGWPSEDSTWETSAALAGAKEVRAAIPCAQPCALGAVTSPILSPSCSPILSRSLTIARGSELKLEVNPEPEPAPAAKPAPSLRQVLAEWERGAAARAASRAVADSVVARLGRSRRPGSGRANHPRLEALLRLRMAVSLNILRAAEPRPAATAPPPTPAAVPEWPAVEPSLAPLQSAHLTSPDHAGGGSAGGGGGTQAKAAAQG